MKAYKGTNKDMVCRNFQYELGKEYTHNGKVILCESGFHACLTPIDCLNYYSCDGENRFFEVEIDGVSDEKGNNSKVAAKSIKFIREITDVNELLDGAEYISTGAFRKCQFIISIGPKGSGASVEIPDSVTSIGNCAFSGCWSLTNVTIPDSVTSIGYGAFAGCSKLISVIIPDSVTYIGDYAYHKCLRLTTITISDSVTFIGDFAFADCSGLTSVIIGNSVTSIGRYAFYECSKLTSVTIGNSVTSIGNGAFHYCQKLTSITIPDSVTRIGNYAFSGCTSLTSVTYNGTIAEWNNIIKGSNWKDRVPATTVHCTDGDIKIL